LVQNQQSQKKLDGGPSIRLRSNIGHIGERQLYSGNRGNSAAINNHSRTGQPHLENKSSFTSAAHEILKSSSQEKKKKGYDAFMGSHGKGQVKIM